MRSTVTLRDVASAANVHPSTASRALNEHTRDMVNIDTVARVLAAAERLGYEPNALAQGLKVRRTMSIGMLIPDLTNPLFPPIVRGIEDRCAQAGYTLLLANTDNDDAKERDILGVMARRRVDGLLIATAHRVYPLLNEMLRSDYPVVLVNRTADEPLLPTVAGDDHAGIGMAVRHLAQLGHRRIAHIGGPRIVSTGQRRTTSFTEWVVSLGLHHDPDLVVNASWFNQAGGTAAFVELLDRGVDFTAVVAANDLLALGCYDVAAERGIRIPQDLSVVGYNDVPFAERFSPPLTSVRIPHYEIGVKAAEMMLETIEDPTRMAVTVRLPPQLRVRGSTAPPRA